MLEEVIGADWAKLNSFSLMDLWKVVLVRDTTKGSWITFLNKLMSYTLSLENKPQFSDLPPSDWLLILEAMERHYLNRKELLHLLLLKL